MENMIQPSCSQAFSLFIGGARSFRLLWASYCCRGRNEVNRKPCEWGHHSKISHFWARKIALHSCFFPAPKTLTFVCCPGCQWPSLVLAQAVLVIPCCCMLLGTFSAFSWQARDAPSSSSPSICLFSTGFHHRCNMDVNDGGICAILRAELLSTWKPPRSTSWG